MAPCRGITGRKPSHSEGGLLTSAPMKPTILLLTCAVLACATLTTFAAEVELSGPTPTATAAELRDGTLVLTLSGNLPLRPGGGFLFGDSGMSLFDATMLLKKAMNEPERRVVLDCSLEFHPGLAAVEELTSILRARPSGKKVACLLDNASDSVMALAAACDEIVMVEAGMLNLDGLAMSTDYYGDALNRFGIKFHAVTSGPAKSAPEPFTSGHPSATSIAEHQRLVDALDNASRTLIARPMLSADAVKAAYAQAPQTSAIAMRLGLVTAVAEPGAWLRNQPAPVRYLKTEHEIPDFSSLFGITNFLSQVMNGEKKTRPTRSVAVIELEGTIIDGDVSMPGYTIAGTDTARLFDRLISDQTVVAVVVRINSGGGSAGASDRAYHALRRLAAAKPVVALYDAVCASGGYYIGCAAQEIMVHRGTITGSIGVFAMIPSLEDARSLLAIHRHTISTGPRSDLFSTDAFTPEKEAAFRQVVSDVDQRFQRLVGERRKLDAAHVHELAGGRVFSGDEAIANGLADRLGDLAAAIARARELAGIKEPLPIERFPEAGGLAARLGLGGVSTDILPAVMAHTLPAELSLWLHLAHSHRLHVMAWRAPMSVE
jgi:protease IV